MTELHGRFQLPLTWVAVGSLVIGGFIGWGALQTRVGTLEQRADQQASDLRANTSALALQDKEIAVIKEQYAEIIRRLDSIDAKLGDPDPPGVSKR